MGLFRAFVIKHDGVIEVINYFLRVFPKIINIEMVQKNVKKNGIEIFYFGK
jgi:hypothetical protein